MFWGLPDPGWKNPDPRSRIEKSRSGMEKIQIRDKHPGSATLHVRILNFIDQEYLIMYFVMINVADNVTSQQKHNRSHQGSRITLPVILMGVLSGSAALRKLTFPFTVTMSSGWTVTFS
jgi:hypothetical protein